jgi:hypothetical protein
MGLFLHFLASRQAQARGRRVRFAAAKIPFGNRLLTMISVWLGLERRANSPRFDMLTGDAGSGFGRATHATHNKALAQAYRRG